MSDARLSTFAPATCPGAPHDLLRIRVEALRFEGEPPAWAASALAAAPWVVRRRPLSRAGFLPVGLRGASRSERAAAWVPPEAVLTVKRPQDLVPAGGVRDLPALRSLEPAAAIFAGLGLGDWGPGGSVGFELATGCQSTTATSDLDLILRIVASLPLDLAIRLRQLLSTLPARADLLIETPHGAVALAEYAEGGPVLLRRAQGPILLSGPLAVWTQEAAPISEGSP